MRNRLGNRSEDQIDVGQMIDRSLLGDNHSDELRPDKLTDQIQSIEQQLNDNLLVHNSTVETRLNKRFKNQAQEIETDLKDALSYVDQGCSLLEASRKVGRNEYWLATYGGQNKEKLLTTIEEFAQEDNLTEDRKEQLIKKLEAGQSQDRQTHIKQKTKRAIRLVIQGNTLVVASQQIEENDYWLSVRKNHYRQEFLVALEEVIQEDGLSAPEREQLLESLQPRQSRRPGQTQLTEQIRDIIDSANEADCLKRPKLKTNQISDRLPTDKKENVPTTVSDLKESILASADIDRQRSNQPRTIRVEQKQPKAPKTDYNQLVDPIKDDELLSTLEQFIQENDLSEREKEALLARFQNADEQSSRDADIVQLKKALWLIVKGCSLDEANRGIDATDHWLSSYIDKNRQKAQQTLNQFVEDNNLSKEIKQKLLKEFQTRRDESDQIPKNNQLEEDFRRAIEFVAQGYNLQIASRIAGYSKNWLAYHKNKKTQLLFDVLEKFIQENKLSEEKEEKLLKRLYGKREYIDKDQLAEKIKRALELIVAGDELSQACQAVGRSQYWLSNYKRRSPATFNEILEDFIRENNLSGEAEERLLDKLRYKNDQFSRRPVPADQLIDKLRRALRFIAKGNSPYQASQLAGGSKNWLYYYTKREHRYLSVALKEIINDKRFSKEEKDRLLMNLFSHPAPLGQDEIIDKLKEAFGLVADGFDMKTASLKVGKGINWLSDHKRKKREAFRIALEEFIQENNLDDQDDTNQPAKLIREKLCQTTTYNCQ